MSRTKKPPRFGKRVREVAPIDVHPAALSTDSEVIDATNAFITFAYEYSGKQPTSHLTLVLAMMSALATIMADAPPKVQPSLMKLADALPLFVKSTDREVKRERRELNKRKRAAGVKT